MAVTLRNRRKSFGVSLDELAAALGPGFSRARLSIAERGLIPLSPSEESVVLAAIDRLGEVHSETRSIIEGALSIGSRRAYEDIRKQAQSLHA
jgi:hypothetical protein